MPTALSRQPPVYQMQIRLRLTWLSRLHRHHHARAIGHDPHAGLFCPRRSSAYICCAHHAIQEKAWLPDTSVYFQGNLFPVPVCLCFSPLSAFFIRHKNFFSKEYLSKLFKSRYGCGIYTYVQEIRMQRAKALLMNPDIKIQSISQRLGYTDNNYFSKAFKNYYGISPTQFRKENSGSGN